MDSLWWLLLLPLPLLLFLLPSAKKTTTPNLPPGPPSIPIVTRLTTLSWLSRGLLHAEHILRGLRARHGPILTLNSARPQIFIAGHSLAHEALVRQGALFADRRPPATDLDRVLISSAPYGPLWRLLRRNLASEILHPHKIKHFAGARRWVLDVLLRELESQAEAGDGVVVVMESFQFAMFCLLVLMCFGDKLDVGQIREIETVQRRLHGSFVKFFVFRMVPRVTKLVFRARWRLLQEIRKKQQEIFVPLIKARREKNGDDEKGSSYVDSLLELSIPEEGGRKLTESELVGLCSEFLSGGTDTTATALEWTMAELVKNPDVQKRLVEEIESVVQNEEEIKEEDLQKVTYLKAVVLESLRRHPPAHFTLPHSVTEDAEIGGYVVPKNATVHFMVAELGWDEKEWPEPMEFRPERFMAGGEGEGVDVTGSREIKMMPFGAGRRICPGLGLAMLHLEYFVANLVREFEWRAVEGEAVDFSERMELTVMMKNHLRARIAPRRPSKKKLV